MSKEKAMTEFQVEAEYKFIVKLHMLDLHDFENDKFIATTNPTKLYT